MDAYLSIVSNRLNEVMKQLTVIATVFLPLSFLTGFFGQNFGWMVSRLGGLPTSSCSGSALSWSQPAACSRCSAGAAGSDCGKLRLAAVAVARRVRRRRLMLPRITLMPRAPAGGRVIRAGSW